MVQGWIDLIKKPFTRNKKEFVSVDARVDVKNHPRSYEMLSRDSSAAVTPITPVKSPESGRRTPDYFGSTARYHAPVRSFSSPRPPLTGRETGDSYPMPTYSKEMNPLAMNRT